MRGTKHKAPRPLTAADLPHAHAICDDRIADLRQQAAAIKHDPNRWEHRHALLRKVDGYLMTKEILTDLVS